MLPSGEQVAIAHGDQRAVITEVGATLRTYVKGGVAVVEGFAGEEVPTGARGQVLFPWPNRIGDGDGRSRTALHTRALMTCSTRPRFTVSCAGGPFGSIR